MTRVTGESRCSRVSRFFDGALAESLRTARAAVERVLEAKVSNNKYLASRIAVVCVTAAVIGASAFADSRHSDGTSAARSRGGEIRRERGNGAGVQRRDDSRVSRERRSDSRVERRSDGSTRSAATRRERESGSTVDVVQPRTDERRGPGVDRDRSTRDRAQGAYDRTPESRDQDRARADRNRENRGRNGYDRNRDANGRNRDAQGRNRGTYDRDRDSRNRNRSYDHDRGSSRRDRGQRYHAHGRVSRVHPYNGGYRVWIVGSPHPFFVPHAYYHRDRFRVGLSIRLGGYYNSRGYYDYYDYDDRYVRSDAELRGTVESVDYRRDTFVVRNEATGSFVTVILRDRRPDDIRPGDFVELYGDWSRYGVFAAYDVERLDW